MVAALVLVQGYGITQDANSAYGQSRGLLQERRNPRYDVLLEHAAQQRSRFADIEQATFFEEPGTKSPQSVPLAPPPAPESGEPVITELAPVPVDVELESVAVPAPVPQPTDQPELGITSCRPVEAAILPTQYESGDSIGGRAAITRPPVDDPRKLKKITEIQPFLNYEPDATVRAEDPCRHLCPRPDGAPCYPEDDAAHLCPEEVVLSNEQYLPRHFAGSVFAWEASNLHYNPLYFEDVQLERYGHTYPCLVQPFASVGLFSLQLAGLPYQMSIDPICKDIYPLGYYRPGECAPKLHYQIPWNTKAAVTQAAVTTGMFYLIP